MSPWGQDDLFNLVAADRHCNAGKRDRLLIGEHVSIWTARDRDALSELGRERDWPVEPARRAAVARAAYTSLAEGIPAWQGRGRVVPFAPEHRASALAAIDTLQADLGRPA